MKISLILHILISADYWAWSAKTWLRMEKPRMARLSGHDARALRQIWIDLLPSYL